MKHKSNPLVTLVVLSWNTLDDTTACLNSLRNLTYPNKEIVVVDNGSHDGSKEYLAAQKDIVYVDLPKNTGFTGGQIAAYEQAKGDYIALINSDALIAKDWLDIAVSIASKDSRIGALGGRAYTWKDDEKSYDTTNDFYSYQIIHPVKGYATTVTTGEEQTEVDSISGAGVLISREAIEKVGYFDNSFFAYFEETDLFARMKRAGFRIIYEPRLHTWHKIAQSTKSKPYFMIYQMHRNRFFFAIKNFDGKYAWKFFWFYLADGARALIRYTRHRDLDNKARLHSLFSSLTALPRLLSQRRRIKKLGNSYSYKLLSRKPPSDITVVIPCYNYAEYVAEALDSVLSQTLKPLRIIVIDDGSIDESREIVRKYESQGVELVAKKNEGVIATKNLGIDMSRTTWTVFLDADDILLPDYLEKLYGKAARNQYDVTYTDMQYFGAREETLEAGRFSFNRLLRTNFIHNSALISTYLLKQSGGYKEVMNGGYEDWELYITLAEAGAKFGYIPKPLLLYRQHNQHSSRNISAEATAHHLHKQVRDLHAASYKKYNHSLFKLGKGLKRVIENPMLPFVVIAVLPLCLLAAIKAFFVTFFARLSYRSRNYLHKRDLKRYEQEEKHEIGEDERQWPDHP